MYGSKYEPWSDGLWTIIFHRPLITSQYYRTTCSLRSSVKVDTPRWRLCASSIGTPLRTHNLSCWLIFYHKILSSSKEMQRGDQREYSWLKWWYHSSSICIYSIYNSFYVALFWNLWVWRRNAKEPFALFSVFSISFGGVLNDTHLRVCSFEMIWIRISDPRSLRWL